MSGWMIAVTGVACLGVLLEILLPEGQTAKYVKGAFSLLVIFVVASPLPGLVGKVTDLTAASSTVTADEGFLRDTAEAYGREKALAAEEYLKEQGYEAEVEVVVSSDKMSKVIKCVVSVHLPVLDAEERNRHIARVREAVSGRLGIPPETVAVEVA